MLLELLVLTLLPFLHQSGRLEELHIDGYHEVSEEFRSFFLKYFPSSLNNFEFEDLVQNDSKNIIALVELNGAKYYFTFTLDLESEGDKFKSRNEPSELIDLLSSKLTEETLLDPSDFSIIFERFFGYVDPQFNRDNLYTFDDDEWFSDDIDEVSPLHFTKKVEMVEADEQKIQEYSMILGLYNFDYKILHMKTNGDEENERVSLLIERTGTYYEPCQFDFIYTPDNAYTPFFHIYTREPEFMEKNKCDQQEMIDFISDLNINAKKNNVFETRKKKTLKWEPASDAVSEHLKTHLKVEGIELVGQPLIQPWGNMFFACPVKLADADDKFLMFLEFDYISQKIAVLDGAKEEDLAEVAATFSPEPLALLDKRNNKKIWQLNPGKALFIGLLYNSYIDEQREMQEVMDQFGFETWELMTLDKVVEVNALINTFGQPSAAVFGLAKKDGSQYFLFMTDIRQKLEYMSVHVTQNTQTQALSYSFSDSNPLNIHFLFDLDLTAVPRDEIFSYNENNHSRLI